MFFKHQPDTPWRQRFVKEAANPNVIVTSTDGTNYRRHRDRLRLTSIQSLNANDTDNTPIEQVPARDTCSNETSPTSVCPKSSEISDRMSSPQRETRTPLYLKDYVIY